MKTDEALRISVSMSRREVQVVVDALSIIQPEDPRAAADAIRLEARLRSELERKINKEVAL